MNSCYHLKAWILNFYWFWYFVELLFKRQREKREKEMHYIHDFSEGWNSPFGSPAAIFLSITVTPLSGKEENDREFMSYFPVAIHSRKPLFVVHCHYSTVTPSPATPSPS
jgi:hypothetical protein